MSLKFLQELFYLYSAEDGLLCEIRSLGTNRYGRVMTRYFGMSRLENAAQFAKEQAAEYDVYVGVLPRFCKAAPGSAGEDRHVNVASWLWCDVDRGSATEVEVLQFLEHIKSRMPGPRMVVLSGSGGVHLYWKLAKPVPMVTDEERKGFSAVLRRVVLSVGFGPSDLHADKSCCNPSRILRVPNTLNHKHSPPAKVEGMICPVYDEMRLAEWDKQLPYEPLPARSIRPKFTTNEPRPEGIPAGLLAWAERGYAEGNRHHDIVGAAAWLQRDTDLPENVAYQLFLTKAENSPGMRALTPQELDKAWDWGAAR